MKVPTPRLPVPRGPEIPWMMALGHYMPHFYTGAVAGQVAWDAAGQPSGWASTLSGYAWWIALAPMAAHLLQHMRRLCERCARSTPLDPGKSVRKWKAALRLVHVEGFYLLWLGVVGLQVLADKTGSPGTFRYAADALTTAVLLVFVAATWQHNRLQPWCPWCNWPKGGEHEEVPDPDPAVSL